MMIKGPGRPLLAITFLAAGAATMLAMDARQHSHSARRSATFQRLVGGLGFGPALDLSRCACSFDPRVEHACSQNLGPVTGGRHFCTEHASSIFYYPDLEP
jgi:hypothetical protein